VSRLIAQLAGNGPAGPAALRTAQATARARVWQIAPPADDDGPLIIDLDATPIDAPSEKEGA
jgi:hypothetical protein